MHSKAKQVRSADKNVPNPKLNSNGQRPAPSGKNNAFLFRDQKVDTQSREAITFSPRRIISQYEKLF